ncbi:MAG: hypothetical protein AAGJ82_06685 [Bacteroidota bacterium]
MFQLSLFAGLLLTFCCLTSCQEPPPPMSAEEQLETEAVRTEYKAVTDTLRVSPELTHTKQDAVEVELDTLNQ